MGTWHGPPLGKGSSQLGYWHPSRAVGWGKNCTLGSGEFPNAVMLPINTPYEAKTLAIVCGTSLGGWSARIRDGKRGNNLVTTRMATPESGCVAPMTHCTTGLVCTPVMDLVQGTPLLHTTRLSTRGSRHTLGGNGPRRWWDVSHAVHTTVRPVPIIVAWQDSDSGQDWGSASMT